MKKIRESDKDWFNCATEVFWGEIAPCDHLVQIYENDEVLLNTLEGFISSGLHDGDSVIFIATEAHQEALSIRLKHLGFDTNALAKADRFISLNAEEILVKFMKSGWPDEVLFSAVIKKILLRARGLDNRRIRAYGEMVALLWAQGHNGATVALENLWNRFCETEAFCLFCAYPKIGFTQDVTRSIEHICATHTKVLAGDLVSTSIHEVIYQRV